jgi:hypothetical protein
MAKKSIFHRRRRIIVVAIFELKKPKSFAEKKPNKDSFLILLPTVKQILWRLVVCSLDWWMGMRVSGRVKCFDIQYF